LGCAVSIAEEDELAMAVDDTGVASWEAGPSMVDQAVQRRLMSRHEVVVDEVRRMLDAGVDLMRDQDRPNPPRVADIIAAAGTSNDAFYRAFGSRDAFLAAIVDEGARRLVSYVRHKMEGGTDPADQLRRGLIAILKQAADADLARHTRAVVGCAPTRRRDTVPRGADLSVQFGLLYEPPLRALGSKDARRDGQLLALAVFAQLERDLWSDHKPDPADLEYLMSVAIRMTAPAAAASLVEVNTGKQRTRRGVRPAGWPGFGQSK
jgi:AcrR family transcriptional regulator